MTYFFEIFGEIFEDFWILFYTLIRAVRVEKAVRVVRAIREVRAVRAVRLFGEVRAIIVVRAVLAQALYKEGEEQDFSHSCFDCH